MTSTTNEQELREQLQKFVDSKDHLYNCAAYGEGLLCCLDEEHGNYEHVMSLIQSYADIKAKEAVTRELQSILDIPIDVNNIVSDRLNQLRDKE